jgi:hypothetical protein
MRGSIGRDMLNHMNALVMKIMCVRKCHENICKTNFAILKIISCLSVRYGNGRHRVGEKSKFLPFST